MKRKGLQEKKRLSQQKRMEVKKNELIEVKEKGITFPDYNPVPVRKEVLTKKQKRVAGLMKYKEKIRTEPTKKLFAPWEYKDRYSYRKQT